MKIALVHEYESKANDTYLSSLDFVIYLFPYSLDKVLCPDFLNLVNYSHSNSGYSGPEWICSASFISNRIYPFVKGMCAHLLSIFCS